MVGIDQYGYITPAFLGVPTVGKDQSGYSFQRCTSLFEDSMGRIAILPNEYRGT